MNYLISSFPSCVCTYINMKLKKATYNLGLHLALLEQIVE